MKIKVKVEEGESSTTTAPKRKTEGRKKLEKKKCKNVKAPSKKSSPETETNPVIKPEVSPTSTIKTEKGHPTTAGKSPRDFSKIQLQAGAGGSDIDSEGSETDGQ